MTDARTLALFQALEVPYATVHNNLDEAGLISYENNATAQVYAGTAAAKTAIETHITNMAAGMLTELESLLDDWIDIGTNDIRIENGAIGNISGITLDDRGDRVELQKQILILVPFYRAHEQYRRGQGSFVRVHR